MSGRHRKPRQPLPVWPVAVVGGWLAAYAVVGHHPTPPAPLVPAPVVKIAVLTQPPAAPKPTVVTVAAVHRIPPLTGGAGLVPNAQALAAYIQQAYPEVASIGGVRPCDSFMEHCRGIALDIMVGGNTDLGNRIDADLLQQAGRFGIQFTLWEQAQHNPSGAVRFMANRGTPTANHYDHLHVRVAS